MISKYRLGGYRPCSLWSSRRGRRVAAQCRRKFAVRSLVAYNTAVLHGSNVTSSYYLFIVGSVGTLAVSSSTPHYLFTSLPLYDTTTDHSTTAGHTRILDRQSPSFPLDRSLEQWRTIARQSSVVSTLSDECPIILRRVGFIALLGLSHNTRLFFFIPQLTPRSGFWSAVCRRSPVTWACVRACVRFINPFSVCVCVCV